MANDTLPLALWNSLFVIILIQLLPRVQQALRWPIAELLLVIMSSKGTQILLCYHTLNLLLEDYPFRPCYSKDFTTIYSFFTLFILMIISLLSSGRGSHRLHFLGLESRDNLASMFIIGAMEGSLATVLAVEVIFWHFPLLKELPL